MKRLLKTSVVLMVILFVLASGFNCALDRMAHSASQSSFTVYNDKGTAVLAYQGDLTLCRAINRPVVTNPNYLHRG